MSILVSGTLQEFRKQHRSHLETSRLKSEGFSGVAEPKRDEASILDARQEYVRRVSAKAWAARKSRSSEGRFLDDLYSIHNPTTIRLGRVC